MRRTAGLVVLAAGLGAGAPAAQAGNLIRNGSFEKPVVPAGGFLPIPTGSSAIPHWLVIGPSDVDPVSGTFRQGCCTFPAHKGRQLLDLTGRNSNTTNGVQQTVATTAGARYTLSFAVGNVVDPSGVFGSSSRVEVLLDGSPLTTVTNSGGGTTLFWQTFTVHFTAPTASSTVAFVNADGPTDNANAIDAVKLVAG